MKTLDALFFFVLFSVSAGSFFLTSSVLNMINDRKEMEKEIDFQEVNSEELKDWLLSEGLASDKAKTIVNYFESSSKSIDSIKSYYSEYSNSLIPALRLAQLLSAFAAAMVLFGALVATRRKKGSE